MKTSFVTQLKGYLLGLLSLFNKKKRTAVVLSNTITPTVASPTVEMAKQSHVPALGKLRDITMMIDQESAELWGRSRYIK